ncbi:MAG TPA: DUF1846 domain-containing protein [Saccharofermentans sp.]|jgi:uncharacterized protein (UPF0371 family)|nr:DUF1846 domain-containing protein [Clostridiaceae bacterium]HOO49609.1 DUF1846 domain-containing protein [Saccharofermentans sp.]HPE27820.1 DUF1846 domain-containing protein [Saccharofermentans sp.]HPJ81728.1 DUF1846 domain-containing protein [Saccharofermentans sp.]HPQ32718.1 DUF1846 domain-containing protein [Saccharofermentans sp.]
MFTKGFDNDKYVHLQSQKIRDRISQFGGKLYLEFGGKLFDDYHASRVLPGFEPDSKVKMLLELKADAEIIIVINADAIEKNKRRGDLGITYDQDVLRLMDAFTEIGLFVGSVVVTCYTGQPSVIKFEKRLNQLGVKVYRHYPIDGYPLNVPLIVSEEGYGKNEYIETTKSLVVVTAPGPGSGKMATCLSQLYHENRRGIKAGYAKFETFPIWSIPLKHPVNIAYEAATADLNDVNMIDPFHLEAYDKTAVNYNRDVEIFPVVNAIFEKIYGKSPYASPTDMGVNMAGFAIVNDDACCEASKQEIIRRYYQAKCGLRQGTTEPAEVTKVELLLNKSGINTSDRRVVGAAMTRAEATHGPAVALELPNGQIVTGKTSDLLGASAAVLLNALKELAGIRHDIPLISPIVIEPIQDLKVNHMGNHNPRLHMDEVLIALAISAATNPIAELAMQKISELRYSEAHATTILSSVDDNVFKKLGINISCEPEYQTKRLYHK